MSEISNIELDELLDDAILMNASDIHLSNGLSPFFRVYGTLGAVDNFPKISDYNMNVIIKDLLSTEEIEKFKKEKNIDTSYSYKQTRLRVHGYYQRQKMSLSLRLIPSEIPTLDDLLLPKTIERFIHLKSGLILVTGITGSGKSTTLAALINEINKTYKKRILTIEDPIEYIHTNDKSMIEQREVGNDVHSFQEATRASLRADPDIILVGEIRDLDTISNAITLAETGHLVFATLHTRSAAESPDRLIDVFPPEQQDQVRMQLANNLEGIISQQLVSNKEGERVPLVEVLITNDAIRNAIKDGSNITAIKDQMQMNIKNGMITKAKSAYDLYISGTCSKDELMVYLNSDEQNNFHKMLDNN